MASSLEMSRSDDSVQSCVYQELKCPGFRFSNGLAPLVGLQDPTNTR